MDFTLLLKNKRARIWIITILLLIIIITIGYCTFFSGKIGKGASIIPNDVTAVVSVAIPRIATQLNFDKIQRSEQYQASIAQAVAQNPVFAEIMRNPRQAGINYFESFFIVYTRNPANITEDFTAIIFSLSNANAFEKVVNKATLETKNNNGNFTSVHLDRLTTVGWNRQFAIFGASDVVLDLDANLRKFFATPANRSVAKEPSFAQAMRRRGEVLFWVSTTPLADDPQMSRALGLGRLNPEIIKGNHIIGQIGFAKGKVNGDATFLFKPELDAVFNTFFNEDFRSANFTRYITDEQRDFSFFTSLNLSGIYNYALSKPELKSAVEAALMKNGIDIKDLFRTFSGDFMVTTYQAPDGNPIAPRIFGTRVFYPENARSYLKMLASTGVIQEVNPDIYLTPFKAGIIGADTAVVADAPPSYFWAILKNDFLFFTNNRTILEQLNNGGYAGSQQSKIDIAKAMKGNLMAGQLDYSRQLNSKGNTSDWEYFSFHWNKQNFEFELVLKDKAVYALQKLIEQNL